MRTAALLGLALATSFLSACGQGIPPQGNYATVSGKVVDATTQKPIAGATVSVNGGVLVAQTDSAGSFSVSPVPPGDWDYTAIANGYASTGLVTSVAPLAPSQQFTITIQLNPTSGSP